MTEASETTRFRPVEIQRLDAFVDAAFAFAVSLLIIAGAEPLRSFDDLQAALTRIPAFACGFALIALFWLGHRIWSGLAPARDGWATALSLMIVFAVLVFVFPLRLLIETATHFISGGLLPGKGLITSLVELRWTYVIYGTGFGLLSVLYALLFGHARRGIDPADAVRRRAAGEWSRTWWLSAATAGVSIAIAGSPWLDTAPWLPGVSYQLIPVGLGLFALSDRLGRRAI